MVVTVSEVLRDISERMRRLCGMVEFFLGFKQNIYSFWRLWV